MPGAGCIAERLLCLGERQKQQKKQDTLRALIAHIHRIHRKSRRTYGSPRVHAELRAEGVICNHKRVARLMRLEGIQGRRKRQKVTTMDSNHAFPVAPNLLNREFTEDTPNEKWVADITPTSRCKRAECTWPWCWIYTLARSLDGA